MAKAKNRENSYNPQDKKLGFSKTDLKQNCIKIKMKLAQMLLLLELLLLLLHMLKPL